MRLHTLVTAVLIGAALVSAALVSAAILSAPREARSRSSIVLPQPRSLALPAYERGAPWPAMGSWIGSFLQCCSNHPGAAVQAHLMRLSRALTGTEYESLLDRHTAALPVVSAGAAMATFGRATVVKTLTGHAFDINESDQVRRSAAEAHPYQTLAALSRHGFTAMDGVGTVAASVPIRSFVEHALADSTAATGNREWAMLVLLLWAEAGPTWLNKLGEPQDLESSVANYVTATAALTGPCYGTHALTVLFAAARLDADYDLFGSAFREELRSRVAACERRILASQLADGRWTPHWNSGTTRPGLAITEDFVATSHLLEALLLLPASPARETAMRRAAEWLAGHIDDLLATTPRGICPATHALSILVLLGRSPNRSEVTPPPETPVQQGD